MVFVSGGLFLFSVVVTVEESPSQGSSGGAVFGSDGVVVAAREKRMGIIQKDKKRNKSGPSI